VPAPTVSPAAVVPDAEPRRHVIVGTAGHIDHGKSTLVEALTGTHPDRLEEEKRRGITIDLGFAFLDYGGVRFGFVDVPGHERFVRNMLAGAGGVDLVLLVVAADESVMPQTREHFDICRLLGIRRGVIALTKSDLAPPDTLSLARLEVEELVRGSFLEEAPIVSVSAAATRSGLEELKRELVRAAESCPPRDTTGAFRLPIDRSFAIKGFGTVVTGTLVTGTLHTEDEGELLPAGRPVRVRGLESGGKKLQCAVAGQRTAVNLAGIEHTEVTRGMTLAPPSRFSVTTRFQARVELLRSARPMRRRFRAHLHQGSAETVAVVRVLEPAGEEQGILPGEARFAELRTAEPMVLLPGDRFVLRQFSPVVTLGGGVVLDITPSRRTRGAGLRQRLEILERGEPQAVLEALLLESPRGLSYEHAARRTGWDRRETHAAAEAMVKAGKARLVGASGADAGWLTLATAYTALVEKIRTEVAAFHRANPLAEGISKEELRIRVARAAGLPLFRAALGELVAGGKLAVAGDTVKLAGREISLAPEEARAKELIEQAFLEAGLTVPALKEALEKLPVEALRAQKILQILLREQVLVRVATDLVFHRAALDRLGVLLADYKKQRGPRMSVPAFKELTGITRKYAIPLLEYLDRERVTRRMGDERVIL